MANILDPTTAVAAKVRPANGLFVTPMPEIGSNGGSYFAGFETASLAFTTGANVLDFRNPNANLVMVNFVEAHWTEMAIAAASATGLRATLQMFVKRTYTAQAITNATALTLSTNNCKLRTNYPTTAAQIGVANATGGITGGTQVDDATPLVTSTQGAQDTNITSAVSPGVNQQRSNDRPLIWTPNPWSGPLILAQNEGFRLLYLVTTAAAVIVSGQIGWTELGSTTYP